MTRHGLTEWARSGRHTGRADIPLLPLGERNAEQLGVRLHSTPWAGIPNAEVRTSQLQRARRTCELAGFADRASVWDALQEVDYGDYEGLTTPQIQQQRSDWQLWLDGVPHGEALDDISVRADEVVDWARTGIKDKLIFAHAHILCAIATRWLGQDLSFAAHLQLTPASISVLGWQHSAPAILHWNDDSHVRMDDSPADG